MTTIIKILAALLVLTACFNASRAALNDYQFQDAVHQGMIFDGRASDAEIVAMVKRLGSAYGITVAEDDVSIRQVGQDVHVDMSYTSNVVLVPGVFARDWTFTPSASTRILIGERRK